MYLNTTGMWLVSQCLLNEPKEKCAVPHNAHQRPLFPNQGLFSPTMPESSSPLGWVLAPTQGVKETSDSHLQALILPR